MLAKTKSSNEESYPKETAEVHKRFQIPNTEIVVTHFACAHKGKVLKQGRMYITQNYVCFFAQLFGKSHRKWITFSDIGGITKENYGLLPNAIKITTLKKKEMLFASFVYREEAFDRLMKQWEVMKHNTVRSDGTDEEEVEVTGRKHSNSLPMQNLHNRNIKQQEQETTDTHRRNTIDTTQDTSTTDNVIPRKNYVAPASMQGDKPQDSAVIVTNINATFAKQTHTQQLIEPDTATAGFAPKSCFCGCFG